MNDGKIIIDRIMAEADKEIEAFMLEGKREADAIMKAAEEKSRREKESYRKNAEEEARKARAKEISGAEMEAKKAILREKQDILEEIIAEAKKRLDESQGKEIIVSAKDKARLADVVKEKGYVLSDETRDIDSGFVVKNGDIEYNYSFDAIIMVQKEEMQITAAKILF